MSPDAGELLRDAAASPAHPLDFERAWRRGRRMRWGRRAVAMVAAGAVAAGAWMVVANDGLPSESLGRDAKPAAPNEADADDVVAGGRISAAEAATLAIRAAADGRWTDARGEYWEYEDTRPAGDRWTVRFRTECFEESSMCSPSGSTVTVSVARRANVQPMFQIDLPSGSSGGLLSLPDDPVDLNDELEYLNPRIVVHRGQRYLWATPVWTGPIPAEGLKARCQAILHRDDGATVFGGLGDAAESLPRREDDRSGDRLMVEVADSIRSGAIVCSVN